MAPTVLITGAARRIGAAIARRFAAAGFETVLHFERSESEVQALAGGIIAQGGRAALLRCDLADGAALAAALAALPAQHPDWRVLVNNASTFDFDSAESPSRPIWEACQSVNLWAAIALSKAFCAARNGRPGAIVNLLDQKLDNLNPDFFSYTLSKAALAEASRMLALAHAPQIRICNVAPGLTLPSSDQTAAEFSESARLNLLERQTQPSDIAEAVVFAATSTLSSGQTLHVDGGQRFIPAPRDIMFAVRTPS